MALEVEERLLKVPEVAAHYGCRQETVRRWIAKGLLPAEVLPNGEFRIRQSDLRQVLQPVEAGK